MNKTESSTLDFRRYIREVKRLWWIFAAAVAGCLALAVIYLTIMLPKQYATATILIENSSTDTGGAAAGRAAGLAGMMRMFSVGGFGSSSVSNEMMLLQSLDLAKRTVQANNLNVTYIERHGLSKALLYPESPIRAALPAGVADTLSKGFMVRTELLPDGRVNAKAMRKKRFRPSIVFDEIKNATLPATLSTPYGEVTLTAGNEPMGDSKRKIDIIMTGVRTAANILSDNIWAKVPDKLANAAEVGIFGGSDEYCESVLTEYLNQYNLRRIERRRENARDEIKFYDERIADLFGSLADTESEIEKFKTANNLVGIKEEAELLVESTIGKADEIVAAKTAQDYYTLVKQTLEKPSNGTPALIPVVESLGNPLIASYNELVLQRQALAKSAKEGNIALTTLDEQIATLRASVLKNIDGMLTENAMRLKAMTSLKSTAESRLNKLPEYERKYINLMRDQTLKNELYMFLLQKRENAALQMASTTTLGFVIDPPHTPLKPSKMRQIIILAVALLSGIIMPAMLVLLLMLWRNRIEDTSDLSALGLEDRATVAAPGNRASMDALRKAVTATPGVNLLLVANLNDSEGTKLVDDLKASLTAIGRTVNAVNTSADNDVLLRQDFLKSLPADSLNIVVIPQPDRLQMLEPVINTDQCNLLVVLKSGSMRRDTFRRMLRGLYADSVITAIMK